MSDPADTQRLLGDMIQRGKIASVDLDAKRCTVTVGDLTTCPLPWLVLRAGSTSTWSPPSVGEQCVVLAAEGDTENGIVLPGLYSDANPAPSSAAQLDLTRFADGAVISYDAGTHQLACQLPDGATAQIVAPGGLTIIGPVKIQGDVSLDGRMEASGDIMGQGTSLHGHEHGLVKAGTDKSGPPA